MSFCTALKSCADFLCSKITFGTESNHKIYKDITWPLPIPVATGSKAWVCNSSSAGIAGSNPAGGMKRPSSECCVLSSIVISATGRSLLQRSPTDCGVSEGDREDSIMRRLWSNRECWSNSECWSNRECWSMEKNSLSLISSNMRFYLCVYWPVF